MRVEMEKYLNNVSAKISSLASQETRILGAAEILSNAMKEWRLLHIYGSEEESSSLIASHFFKAGKPIYLNPMLDPSLDPAHGSYRNAMCMTVSGLSPCILNYYEYVNKGDPIILIGSDPSLMGFAEALEWAKTKGLQVIAIACTDVPAADISLKTGSESYVDGTYTAIASTILELIFRKVKETVPDSCIWMGKRYVDLEGEKEKINKVLFQVKHL